jgi:FAD/FMN-containing dehydrogenase
LRSSGGHVVGSGGERPDLFAATVGGLGLTGLILAAELRLRRVESPAIREERIRFGGLDEFFSLSADSDATHEHTVAWVDCLAAPGRAGRGVFFRGNHAPAGAADRAERAGRGPGLRVPLDLPGGLLNPVGLRAFNAVYYRLAARPRRGTGVVDHRAFFFPLDGIRDWNRMYGRRGFLQYQCVVPPGPARDAVREILDRVARSREGSFLAVLKNFGARRSPGLLSFPRAGTTLALDLPQRGERTFRLLDGLDAVVRDAGGAVYPAKDARMSPESFHAFFPEVEDFRAHVDPAFSSSFWRRVRGAEGP